MMLDDKWWETAAQVYQRWGYLVFGSLVPHPIGEICDTATIGAATEPYSLPQPFRITGPGTREEYLAQIRFAGVKVDQQRIPPGAYFYRAVTE